MYTVRKMPLLKARRYLEDVKANKQANRRAATIGKVPNLAKKKTLVLIITTKKWETCSAGF